MHVSNAVDVSAGVEKDSHAFEISVRRSKMQRAGVVSGVAGIRIGPVLDQQPHRIPVTHGQMQFGAAPRDALSSEIRIIL
jgi:hypothetical protein